MKGIRKSSDLRAKLMKEPLGVLRKQAIEEGIDQEKVDVALDFKEDLVDLIISHRKKDSLEPEPEPEESSVFTIFIIIIAIIIFGIYSVYFLGTSYFSEEVVYSVDSFMQYIPAQLFYAVTILTIFLLLSLLDPIKNYYKQMGDEYDKNDKKNDILFTIVGVVIFLYFFQKILGVVLEMVASLDGNSKGSVKGMLPVIIISPILIIFFGYFLSKTLNILMYRDTTRLTRTSFEDIIRKNKIRIRVISTIILFMVLIFFTALPGEPSGEMDLVIRRVSTGIYSIIMLSTFLSVESNNDDAAKVKTELQILFKSYDSSQLKNIPELLEKNVGREWILLSEKKAELGVDIIDVTKSLEELYTDTNLEHKIEKIPSILKRAKEKGRSLYVVLEEAREKHKDKIKPKPKPEPKPPHPIWG